MLNSFRKEKIDEWTWNILKQWGRLGITVSYCFMNIPNDSRPLEMFRIHTTCSEFILLVQKSHYLNFKKDSTLISDIEHMGELL